MNATTKLLLSGKDNIILNTQLAVEIGLNEAIVLRQVYYWVEHYEVEKKNFRDGKYWVYNSMKQWRTDNFPFMSEKTIERAFKSLKEKKLILVGDYSYDRMKRPNWYTVNDEKFDELIKRITKSNSNSDELKEEVKEYSEKEETKRLNGVRQNDCMQSDTRTDCYNIYNNINNTDTENTNRDYITDTTDNSFSKEKVNSNSPKGNSNSFSSEKKSERCPKHKKLLTEKELEQANAKMPYRARDIAYKLTNNKDMSDNVFYFFGYFLNERKKHTGTWHIPLNDTTLAKVIATITEDIKVDRGDYDDTYFTLVDDTRNDDYKEVIDKYFETKFKNKTDYSIVHFTQENVLINIMNHCGKENWCMSGI